MAIADDIYDRCKRCLDDAAALAQDWEQGKHPSCSAVMARRAAADIAADAVCGALHQTFITPVDREDLWVWWDACETVLRAVENVTLPWYGAVPTVCMQAVAHACEAVREVTCGTSLCMVAALQAVREVQRLCHETAQHHPDQHRVCEAIWAVAEACERACGRWRYITLKNT